MITKINANTTTSRKNNPNFKARFDGQHQMYLATGNCGHGNKLITCTSAGVFTKAENEEIIKKLVEKYDNPILNTIAKKFGLLPEGRKINKNGDH